MLIYEENENHVCLAFGVPRKWLEDGKVIEVKNSQTCFGPVSYKMVSHAGAGHVNVSISRGSSPVAPADFEIKFRHPEGKPITRVTVGGKTWKQFDKEVVRIPGSISKSEVVAYFD